MLEFLRLSIICWEAALLIFLLVLLGVAPGCVRPFARLRKAFRALARRREAAVALVFALTLILRMAVWPVMKIRPPGVNDEFSYLLMADTFASGRLANPTHPLWIHFETLHVLQHPTYASMYPVAQGLFLAAGQVAHAPWLGVWLSAAMMCAAICWMLQAWLPAEWALAGGLLAVLRLAVFNYWMNSYWGGAVAALGGALVLGALPRLLRWPRAVHAVVLAVGMALLANSRPYEGFALCLVPAAVLLLWVRGRDQALRWLGLRSVRPERKTLVLRVLAPLAVVLCLTFAGMGYYFFRVTGSAHKLPHLLEREQYSVAQFFIWQPDRPTPAYDNERLKRFYTGWETDRDSAIVRFATFWIFYIGPALSIPFVLVPFLFRNRRIRLLFLTCVWGTVALLLERWTQPHYIAPFVAVLLALLLQSMRLLIVWLRRAQPRWRALTWAIPATIVLAFGLRAAARPLRIATEGEGILSWGDETGVLYERQEIVNSLLAQGGRHLVLVHYEPGYPVLKEWVYNEARIDNSPIVWALELDAEHNRRLLEYFAGRQVHTLDLAPEKAPVLSPPPAPAKPR